ncbi:hypothetical protein Tco_0835506 [Tanacetum coccineum]
MEGEYDGEMATTMTQVGYATPKHDGCRISVAAACPPPPRKKRWGCEPFHSGKCPTYQGVFANSAPLDISLWSSQVVDFQFGVGVPGGCEAVLHSVNRLIESKGNEVGLSMLLVDFKNAFNLVDRSVLLEETRAFIMMTPLLWSCQGSNKNPLGLLFALIFASFGQTIKSIVALDRQQDEAGSGLFLNVDKTELFWPVEDPRSRTEGVVTASGPGFGDTMRLRPLPIKLGGLGILSAGDIIQYAFLASRLQSSTLQTKILVKTGIESQGSSFKHALDVFNTICNIDVLSVTGCTSAPHMMKSLAKCYFGVIKKDLVSKVAVPMFSEGSLCPSCNTHPIDQWRDHAVHCSSKVGVKFRHNLVRDILVDICSKVGIMVRKEAPMGFLSEDGKDL